ncbi:Peptidase metallopeptidase domain-containing protein [Caenorhabditis elegans]|uniref:Peptidase metallopeptidase domain-containing protein n=1 Tax=Caenorhabditis elegans TaxID=6239 RepID=O17913_CAEEL|nr:Peptidase metallopeptidase domain-containing protein [Caenorhabditis elegans]CAB08559.5 Peptidase metallopeptidase domain-containing protein [Caenorhabditis elegans]|eukprot:NP_001333542.1 Zinc MetalloProtease [Caenorhabditis elegans]
MTVWRRWWYLYILSGFIINNVMLESKSRVKRYSIEGSYWGKSVITYRLKQPSQRMSLSQQKAVFARAFATWEEHTRLWFVAVDDEDEQKANIDIVFAAGDHEDGEPFDGKGNILAHAFFPRYGGDVHFDEDELWSANKTKGVDLYAVAVHEIGHSLGLKHSSNHLSIMAPFYKQYTGAVMHLHQDDISAVKRLYGAPVKIRKKASEHHIWRSELCTKPYLDAVTTLKNGTILAFRGKMFFELKTTRKWLLPRKINRIFPFEGPLEAATTDRHGNVYFFKKDTYWVMTKHGDMMNGYPKKISQGLTDTPDGINAALYYHEDGKPYFFKKSYFWQYSRYGKHKLWPRAIVSIFENQNSPPEIDAAFQLNNTSSFLFHQNKYWKVSGDPMRIEKGFPRSLSRDWFNCL